MDTASAAPAAWFRVTENGDPLLSVRAVVLLPLALENTGGLCKPLLLVANQRPSESESRSVAQWKALSVERSWDVE